MKDSRTKLGWLRCGLLACSMATMSCAGGWISLESDAAVMLESWRAKGAQRRAAEEAEELSKRVSSVEELLAQGDQFRDDGELADALFSYVRAHQGGADRVEPAERIAFLHLRDEPRRAEAIFEVLLEKDPYSATLRTGLALTALAEGDVERARIELDEAIALDPGAPTPRVLLAVILDRLDDHEAAQEMYRAANALRPEDWVILNNLGVSYLLSNDPESAEAALQKAATLRPGDAALRNNLGLALGLIGRPDEAFEQFTRAAGRDQAHNNLGWVYYLQGEYALALEQFEAALDVKGEAVLTVLRNIELARAALEQQQQEVPEIGFEAIPVEGVEEELGQQAGWQDMRANAAPPGPR
jgi:Flp pilus assembly protein TadD